MGHMLATMDPMSSLIAASPQMDQMDFHVTPEEVDLFFQSWESEHPQPALQDRLLDSVISRLLSDSGCATATQQNAGAEAQTIIQPNAPWIAAQHCDTDCRGANLPSTFARQSAAQETE